MLPLRRPLEGPVFRDLWRQSEFRHLQLIFRCFTENPTSHNNVGFLVWARKAGFSPSYATGRSVPEALPSDSAAHFLRFERRPPRSDNTSSSRRPVTKVRGFGRDGLRSAGELQNHATEHERSVDTDNVVNSS